MRQVDRQASENFRANVLLSVEEFRQLLKDAAAAASGVSVKKALFSGAGKVEVERETENGMRLGINALAGNQLGACIATFHPRGDGDDRLYVEVNLDEITIGQWRTLTLPSLPTSRKAVAGIGIYRNLLREISNRIKVVDPNAQVAINGPA